MTCGSRFGRAGMSVLGALGVCALGAPLTASAQGLQIGGQVRGGVEADPDSGLTTDHAAQLDAQVQAAQPPPAPAPPPPPSGAAPPAPPPRRPAAAVHRVREGDTLWDVSAQYYGDAYQWPRLWSYNPEITNPHFIYPGDVLRLVPAEGPAGPPPAAVAGMEEGGPSRRTISRRPPASIRLREQAYLDRDALQQSGTIIGSPATHMLLSTHDELYVKFEAPPRAPVGKEMSIYRHVSKEENSAVAATPYEYDPESPGEIVRILGTVRLLGYDPETQVARGEIVEALDVIERGFRVAEVPRRFVEVPPRTNEKAVESTVVAAMRPVQLVGQHQVVFLGVGAKQGVKPGNRFFVVRRHDGWRRTLPKQDEAVMGARRPVETFPDEQMFPEDVLAEIVVLHTRPDSATAMVTHSVREIAPGDRVRMPEGY